MRYRFLINKVGTNIKGIISIQANNYYDAVNLIRNMYPLNTFNHKFLKDENFR